MHRAPRCAGLRYVHHRWELFSRDTTYRVYLAPQSPETPVRADAVRQTGGPGAALGTSQAQEALAANPLSAPRGKGARVLLFVVTSSRGLCGGYNARVLQATKARMRELAGEGRQASLVVMGKKGLSYFRYHNQPVEIQLPDIDENIPFLNLRQVLDEIIRVLPRTRWTRWTKSRW